MSDTDTIPTDAPVTDAPTETEPVTDTPSQDVPPTDPPADAPPDDAPVTDAPTDDVPPADASRTGFVPDLKPGDACTTPDGRKGTVVAFAGNPPVCFPIQDAGIEG